MARSARRSAASAGDYSEDEKLDLFARRVDELWDCQLVKSGGLRASFTLNVGEDSPLELETSEPDKELLRSFLLTFRHFVSPDEPVFVNRIHNILWRRLEADQERKDLAATKKRWTTTREVGALGLSVNGRLFTPAEVLDFWVNGRYFHTDKEKAAVLDELDPTGTLLTRYQFLDHLVEATEYITFLGNLIVEKRGQGRL